MEPADAGRDPRCRPSCPSLRIHCSPSSPAAAVAATALPASVLLPLLLVLLLSPTHMLLSRGDDVPAAAPVQEPQQGRPVAGSTPETSALPRVYYRRLPQRDCPRRDIRLLERVSLADMVAHCNADPACKGFNYSEKLRYGFLKHDVSEAVHEPAVDLFIKEFVKGGAAEEANVAAQLQPHDQQQQQIAGRNQQGQGQPHDTRADSGVRNTNGPGSVLPESVQLRDRPQHWRCVAGRFDPVQGRVVDDL